MRGNSAQKTEWDQLAERSAPSWYLDPLVGRQKRQVYQDLIRRWVDGFRPHTVLKTDVFEEAHGADQILFDLLEDMPLAVGMDVAYATVAKASVVRQADCTLCRAARPRLTFSRMSEAVAVQMKGVGCSLCWAM